MSNYLLNRSLPNKLLSRERIIIAILAIRLPPRESRKRAEICIENPSEISLLKISYNRVTEYDRI
jgi:hypothetical protein